MEGYGNENPGAFQSTRPLRGATALLGINAVVLSISTHAPLAGRDTSTLPSCSTPAEFQPTRPLRGATRRYPTHEGAPPHFNPRAPCGARRWTRPHSSSAYDFNPRAPCGARPLWLPSTVLWDIFQPTRPLRGATSGNTVTFTEGEYFNPRAPCGARRRKPDDSCGRYPDFNPRAPCGARLWRASPKARRSRHFNPRAPCGARPLVRRDGA